MDGLTANKVRIILNARIKFNNDPIFFRIISPPRKLNNRFPHMWGQANERIVRVKLIGKTNLNDYPQSMTSFLLL
jgi:hypothetical protein